MGKILSLRDARVVTRQSAMRTGWFAPQLFLAQRLASLVLPIPGARLGVRATFHLARDGRDELPRLSRAVRETSISGFYTTPQQYANTETWRGP